MPGKICASCHEEGGMACKNCQLVVYCSRECQVEHWKKEHKKHCKSPLMKADWQPAWVKERRSPDFSPLEMHTNKNGEIHEEHLWGSIPALDLIQLESHEGTEYQGDMRVLSASTCCHTQAVRTKTEC
jgi:hypothetical protein